MIYTYTQNTRYTRYTHINELHGIHDIHIYTKYTIYTYKQSTRYTYTRNTHVHIYTQYAIHNTHTTAGGMPHSKYSSSKQKELCGPAAQLPPAARGVESRRPGPVAEGEMPFPL